jgi:hypothetical protein
LFKNSNSFGQENISHEYIVGNSGQKTEEFCYERGQFKEI